MMKINHGKILRLLLASAIIGAFATVFAQENIAQAQRRGGGGGYPKL